LLLSYCWNLRKLTTVVNEIQSISVDIGYLRLPPLFIVRLSIALRAATPRCPVYVRFKTLSGYCTSACHQMIRLVVRRRVPSLFHCCRLLAAVGKLIQWTADRSVQVRCCRCTLLSLVATTRTRF